MISWTSYSQEVLLLICKSEFTVGYCCFNKKTYKFIKTYKDKKLIDLE